MTDFSVDYFLAKFEAIPEEEWCTERYISSDLKCRCALGHCGMTDEFDDCGYTPPKASRLIEIMPDITAINDGLRPFYPQPTPKQRILAALRDIKAGQR